MAWHSGADFIKDLADIDEFDAFGNKDSFSVSFSFGRGIKTQEKPKYVDNFIDPRTGEVINLEDENLYISNTYYKTKGRGNVLGCISRSKSQLQKQLRLARPLGSSDEVFESFCRRNMPINADKNSIRTSDLESDPQKSGMQNDNFVLLSNKVRKRIKATRNSKLQSNALISSLLSKGLNQSYENTGKKENEISCMKEDNCFQKRNNFENNDNFNDCENENNIYYDDNETTTSSVSVSTPELNDKNASVSSVEKYGSGEEIILDCLNVYKDKREIRPVACNSTRDASEEINSRNEIYRKIGERLQRKTYSYEKQSYGNIFDFKPFSEYINSEETDSENEQKTFTESVSKHFIINESDFPPLRKT